MAPRTARENHVLLRGGARRALCRHLCVVPMGLLVVPPLSRSASRHTSADCDCERDSNDSIHVGFLSMSRGPARAVQQEVIDRREHEAAGKGDGDDCHGAHDELLERERASTRRLQ